MKIGEVTRDNGDRSSNEHVVRERHAIAVRKGCLVRLQSRSQVAPRFAKVGCGWTNVERSAAPA